MQHQLYSAQVFLTPQYLGIAMEFAPGGDMFEYVVKKNGLREDEARWFFQQLVVGLDYCHKMVRRRADQRTLAASAERRGAPSARASAGPSAERRSTPASCSEGMRSGGVSGTR